jgi:hypothetical protein
MRRPEFSWPTCLAVVLLTALAGHPALADDPNDDVQVHGRVFGPDGKPKSGARIGLLPNADKAKTVAEVRSDAEGRFQLSIKKSSIQDASDAGSSWRSAEIIASADGCGPDWIEAGQIPVSGEWTPRLVVDEPIEGTVTDLGGTPLAGVTIRLGALHASQGESLDPLLARLRDNPFEFQQRDQLGKVLWSAPPGVPAEYTTDRQGCFRIAGLGRERKATLEIAGPNIERLTFYALTRRDANLKALKNLSPANRSYLEGGANLPVVYPSRFQHLAGPSRPIIGTVRDGESQKPIPSMGVTIYAISRESFVHVKSDAQGRYRIEGVPASGKLRALAFPMGEEPYLKATHEMTLTATDLKPVTFDFNLARGILIQGRLTDASTGKAVGGSVTYMAYSDNPFVKDVPQIGGDGPGVQTKSDGTYTLVALPGPGALGARATDDRFTMSRPEQWGRPADSQGMYETAQVGLANCGYFHKVIAIDPPKQTSSLTMNIGLDPGRTLRGTLIDPDGKPVSGATVSSRTSLGFTDTLADASVEVTGLELDRPRPVWFYHSGRNLGRMLLLPGSETGPLTVTLQPCGSFLGRAVDSKGMPRPNVRVFSSVDGKPFGRQHQNVHTDSDGRFRITGLLAGLSYILYIEDAPDRITGLAVRSGETRDLGDLTPDTKVVK